MNKKKQGVVATILVLFILVAGWVASQRTLTDAAELVYTHLRNDVMSQNENEVDMVLDKLLATARVSIIDTIWFRADSVWAITKIQMLNLEGLRQKFDVEDSLLRALLDARKVAMNQSLLDDQIQIRRQFLLFDYVEKVPRSKMLYDTTGLYLVVALGRDEIRGWFPLSYARISSPEPLTLTFNDGGNIMIVEPTWPIGAVVGVIAGLIILLVAALKKIDAIKDWLHGWRTRWVALVAGPVIAAAWWGLAQMGWFVALFMAGKPLPWTILQMLLVGALTGAIPVFGIDFIKALLERIFGGKIELIAEAIKKLEELFNNGSGKAEAIKTAAMTSPPGSDTAQLSVEQPKKVRAPRKKPVTKNPI